MNESINFRDYFLSEPPEFQAEVERNARKLIQQVEDLKAIREIVGMSQTEIARKMQTDQGEISRIERRTDIALQTLRHFVEHVGGELDIVVRLPGHSTIRLNKLSDERVVDSPTDRDKLATSAR